MKCKYPERQCEFRIATYEMRSPSEGQCRLKRRKNKVPCEYDFQKLLQITVNPKKAYDYARAIMEGNASEIPATIRKMID